MTRALMGWLSLLLVLAMAGTGLAVALSLPDGVYLPVHWNGYGVADRMGSKWEALLMPASVSAFMALIFYFLPSLEPRAQNLERSRGLYMMAWLGMLIVMVTAHVGILGSALGWGLPIIRMIQGSIGLLFVLIGNQLGKSRRMFLTGIRTPWTLASEEVWIATHRFAGKLVVGSGLLLILAAVLPLPTWTTVPLLIGVILGSTLVPMLYSFWLWRREKKAGQASGQVSSSE